MNMGGCRNIRLSSVGAMLLNLARMIGRKKMWRKRQTERSRGRGREQERNKQTNNTGKKNFVMKGSAIQDTQR